MVQLIVEEEESKPRRGSVIGRQVVPRYRHCGHYHLMTNYFVSNPVYGDDLFRRRYVTIILSCIYGFGDVGVDIIHSDVPMVSGLE
jgi:hypothetical protein